MLVKKPEPHGILNKTQMEFLTRLNQLPDSSAFYLTGDTALAEFYLGHRLSYDLDLFTTVAGLIRPFCLFMESAMEQQGFSLRAVRRMESFAEYEVALGHDTLRIQLAYDSPFRFAEPAPTPFGLVNDFQDIVVDKLLAFFGWAEPRDAVDLYFILQDVDFWELADMESSLSRFSHESVGNPSVCTARRIASFTAGVHFSLCKQPSSAARRNASISSTPSRSCNARTARPVMPGSCSSP